jgi:hypothetical protein
VGRAAPVSEGAPVSTVAALRPGFWPFARISLGLPKRTKGLGPQGARWLFEPPEYRSRIKTISDPFFPSRVSSVARLSAMIVPAAVPNPDELERRHARAGRHACSPRRACQIVFERRRSRAARQRERPDSGSQQLVAVSPRPHVIRRNPKADLRVRYLTPPQGGPRWPHRRHGISPECSSPSQG